MIKGLFVTLIILVVVIVSLVFVVGELDKHSGLRIPGGVRTQIRKTLRYCVDGNKIYKNGEILSTSDECRFCVCGPKLGGVVCSTNSEPPECK